MVMTGLIQSPAGELLPSGHERAVCEVGNPKLQSWTPPSLHPANLRPPKKCPADPLRVFMSRLCLGATARSHFHCRTPLSGRPPRCLPLVRACVCLVFVCTHVCPPACLLGCMHASDAAICEKALKANVWMREVARRKKKERFL